MEIQLRTHYDIEHCAVSIVPLSFTLPSNTQGTNNIPLNIPPSSFTLFLPAVYYPHKNIEMCIPLAQKIKDHGEDIRIILTLSEEQHPRVKKFFKQVFKNGLEDIIINLGQLQNAEVFKVFRECNALFMPTLLESFGIIYLEAMYHKKLIFTSNLSFAHAVCQDSALYFDPYDADDIFQTIQHARNNADLVQEKVALGRKILFSLPSTSEIQEQYLQIMLKYKNRRKKK